MGSLQLPERTGKGVEGKVEVCCSLKSPKLTVNLVLHQRKVSPTANKNPN